MNHNHFPRRIGAGYEYWQFERYGAWFVADLTGERHKVDPETSRGLRHPGGFDRCLSSVARFLRSL